LALPLIREPLDLEPYLATLAPESTLVFCDEEAEARPPLAALSSVGPGAVVVLIGPEGGFDDSERRRLLAHQHVIRLSLGPRILRADTAGVAALALVQAACGDWR
jgi:16S rRNA (uracil1498-N3)-methyltransferase